MRRSMINILLDAQWGSSGKGKFAAWLAEQAGVTFASSSNGPNAGHSVVRDGKKFVFKCLPAAAIVPTVETALLTGASVFDVEQLAKECAWTKADVVIHDRAVVLRAQHRLDETQCEALARIASTQQGTAAAMIEKILRKPDILAYTRSGQMWPAIVHEASECRSMLRYEIERGGMVLHEVSQGFALSIDHGSHYPHCTSRNCTTAKGLDDLGISPRLLGDVYLNVRPYPIRVGNLERDGVVIGESGGFYPDCVETTWDEVGRQAGMPDDEIWRLFEAELTTVTKRLRRVCTFSRQGFRDAVLVNGATKILLNFGQYLDWSIYGQRGSVPISDLPERVFEFVRDLESISGCPVVAIGTGADHSDVLVVER